MCFACIEFCLAKRKPIIGSAQSVSTHAGIALLLLSHIKPYINQTAQKFSTSGSLLVFRGADWSSVYDIIKAQIQRQIMQWPGIIAPLTALDKCPHLLLATPSEQRNPCTETPRHEMVKVSIQYIVVMVPIFLQASRTSVAYDSHSPRHQPNGYHQSSLHMEHLQMIAKGRRTLWHFITQH